MNWSGASVSIGRDRLLPVRGPRPYPGLGERQRNRPPNAAEYWHELDVRMSSVLAGKTQPKAALDDTYQAWEQITERFGRESQKKLYAESYA